MVQKYDVRLSRRGRVSDDGRPVVFPKSDPRKVAIAKAVRRHARTKVAVFGYDENGDNVTEDDMRETYQQMLDDIYGNVDICGLSFNAGEALKKLDPIAFDLSFSDWCSSEEEDGRFFENYDDYLEYYGLEEEN